MFLHETTNHHRSAIASMKGPTQAPAIAPAVPTAKPEVVTDGEVEIHVSRPHRHALVHVPIHAIISGKKPAISEERRSPRLLSYDSTLTCRETVPIPAEIQTYGSPNEPIMQDNTTSSVPGLVREDVEVGLARPTATLSFAIAIAHVIGARDGRGDGRREGGDEKAVQRGRRPACGCVGRREDSGYERRAVVRCAQVCACSERYSGEHDTTSGAGGSGGSARGRRPAWDRVRRRDRGDFQRGEDTVPIVKGDWSLDGRHVRGRAVWHHQVARARCRRERL
ncbi:hypothetical protein BJV77DRAFT_961466 [Russula vinacea]|nr:hypothetical protein BJV77DRAFT_961466 [Russula vinacea]